MFLKDVEIISNKEIAKNYYQMCFESKEIAKESKIGQFLEIKAGIGINNLLRKPISINDVDGDKIQILYRAIGKGTKCLSDLKAGDKISILGPLGNGFPEIRDKEIIIAAGGIGCGPFNFVMRELPNWRLFYGFRDSCEFLLEGYLRECDKERVTLTTDNGTMGEKGFITEKIEDYLKNKINRDDCVIFSCGPEPMLKKVAAISRKYGVESFLSLEEYMGCGIGACVGCVKKIRNSEKIDGWEYKKVCKDGPVFRGSEVIWE